MRIVIRPARLLAALLGCALAACAAPRRTEGPAAAPEAALRSAAPQSCAVLPPAFSDTILGPWPAFEKWVAARASFAEGSTATALVPLCRDCVAVTTEIVSETRTPCATRENLTGNHRLLGMLRVKDGGAWNRENPSAGDSLYLFADDAGSTIVVYRNGALTATLPRDDWHFYYCQHGEHTVPRAEWRDREVAGIRRSAADFDDDDGSGGQLSYGWMACANGCCQFYGPPPSSARMIPPDPQVLRGRDFYVRLGVDCDVVSGGGH
ncbi:MAG TPA: hypothetical protein VHG91_08760 [Longimicrobium sp.]|nr:hypothetical protein [Longimicrobium sp.]